MSNHSRKKRAFIRPLLSRLVFKAIAAAKLSDPDAGQSLAALEAASDGIFIVDAGGLLTYINPSLRMLHGIAPGAARKMIGQPWSVLYDSETVSHIQADFLPDIGIHGAARGAIAMTREGRPQAMVDLSLSEMLGGGLVGIVRREAGEALSDDEGDLSAQDRMRAAQAMEALGRLATGIAHDFNNLLTAMCGYAEFLIEDLADGTQTQIFARNILQAGHQARLLIERVLSFSRRPRGDCESLRPSSAQPNIRHNALNASQATCGITGMS